MEFKIDTKDTFTIIMPLEDKISANLTGALIKKWEETRQSGSKNFIIDFKHSAQIEEDAINDLINWHENSYAMESSLVFTGINKTVLASLKKDEKDLLLNIAPRMDEAIDIISMEILERDLFGEE
jgi:anti-anti-sigma regulatory factor